MNRLELCDFRNEIRVRPESPIQNGIKTGLIYTSDERASCHARFAVREWPIHSGHSVEYIETDIWVRFQKLRGHRRSISVRMTRTVRRS